MRVETPEGPVATGRRPSRPAASGERSLVRALALPREHGGWGLTFEPVLLGLLVAWSWAGLAIGVATLLAFVVRTPLKLALGDWRRQRSLPRTRLAAAIAGAELASVGVLGALAVAGAGWAWVVPVAFAAPLFAIELSFDIRSRGRRLLPELCGGVGIAAAAAAIVIAGGGAATVAVAVWLILAGRATGSIPFVRTQIQRLHGRSTSIRASDAFQLAAVALVGVAAVIEWPVVLGAGGVALLALAQLWWVRRPVPPAKRLGLVQMALGLAVVLATTIGVLAWT